MSEICERSGAPTKGERRGKLPLKAGEGASIPHRPPLKGSLRKRMERRDNSVMPAKRHSST